MTNNIQSVTITTAFWNSAVVLCIKQCSHRLCSNCIRPFVSQQKPSQRMKHKSICHKSLRCEVSFNLFICHPFLSECCNTVTDESSMQIFIDIVGLQPRRQATTHLIGVACVKTPKEVVRFLLRFSS
ncbi:hypothetical protein HPP92_008075 [Vanilla planifolia]|uniref:Uncharacterized protein n=1 Tax=Vanilla planifolia TaxID=51239 RepID=A0A835VA74_VANPL|nr:hypothetical protein HPP92_008075 [Vanilla planifolia]